MDDRLRRKRPAILNQRWPLIIALIVGVPLLLDLGMAGTTLTPSDEVGLVQSSGWVLDDYTEDLEPKRITNRWGGAPIEWTTSGSPTVDAAQPAPGR